jgi:hypothetical protein
MFTICLSDTVRQVRAVIRSGKKTSGSVSPRRKKKAS